MRYGDGGGLGPQARARREQVRLEAAKMFADAISAPQVTAALQVSTKSVWDLLHRAGFTPQQPITRAAERDEQTTAHWRRYQWPAVKGSRAGGARGSVSSTPPVCR